MLKVKPNSITDLFKFREGNELNVFYKIHKHMFYLILIV